MPRGIHFEIPSDDPERAVRFYREIFGWEITKYDGPVDYWLATTGPGTEPGIDGAIMPAADRRAEGRSQDVLITFSVPSVDEFIRNIKNAGGNVIRHKTAVPGIGYNAYCRDPDGHEFGLFQNDPEAK